MIIGLHTLVVLGSFDVCITAQIFASFGFAFDRGELNFI